MAKHRQPQHPVPPGAAGVRNSADLQVVLCDCPQRHPHLDMAEFEAGIAGGGFAVKRYRQLCRTESFRDFMEFIKSSQHRGTNRFIIGACNRALIGDLVAQAASAAGSDPWWELVDLLEISDCEDFLAECRSRTFAASESEPPTCLWRSPARRFDRSRRQADPQRVLVMGGGVSGCQAALDLAHSGLEVTLVEADLSLGGNMARLDKTFPTLDCSICILGPKLVQTANEAAVTILPQSRVVRVSGRPGRFHVEVAQQARYVDMEKCSGCGACMEACPVIVPNAWNMGLKPGKAIGLVFEQAVPLRSAIQKEYCIECGLCEQACEREAISLRDRPRKHHLRVGAIVIAHGARSFAANRIGPYGYGRLPQVITNLEFERLVCSTGPTQGQLLTAAARPPDRIAFIQCAGSRNERFLPYCSGFCCTASIKEAMLALEHRPNAEVTIFFNDIRTTGKNFEGLYLRARERGVRFVKALPSRIERGEKDAVLIHYDAPGAAGHSRLAVDLAVLAAGLEPRVDGVQWLLPELPQKDRHGFYQDRHPWAGPLESTCDGIFLAGACHGPRDITQTVTESSGVAARVIRYLNSGK